MKTLLIERATYGSSKHEVIMLHDLENKRSLYVYTNEVNYEDWVIEQAKAFKNNGYKIVNNTEIKINELAPKKRVDRREKQWEEQFAEWKQKNVIGFMLWEIQDPNKRFILQAHQTRHGIQIVQIFPNKEFIVFKQ